LQKKNSTLDKLNKRFFFYINNNKDNKYFFYINIVLLRILNFYKLLKIANFTKYDFCYSGYNDYDNSDILTILIKPFLKNTIIRGYKETRPDYSYPEKNTFKICKTIVLNHEANLDSFKKKYPTIKWSEKKILTGLDEDWRSIKTIQEINYTSKLSQKNKQPNIVILTGDARQVVWFALAFNTVISLISMLVVFVLYLFTNIISISEIGLWFFFIPISIFMNGVSAAILTWANRIQNYKQLSFNRVIQALITAAIQITLGILIKNETGLIVGLLVGQLLSVILLIWRFGTSQKNGIGKPQTATFRQIAIQYKSLLIYSTPSEFINNLINQTPIFLLQKFGGVSYVGYYNFTQRFLGLPQQFLSSAIVDVFKQKASALYSNTGNCQILFIKTFKVLTGLAIIPAIVSILFAPQIFIFVFGNSWEMAGVFAQYLSIMFFFRFIASPLSYIYIIAGKLKEDFFLHILFLVFTTLAFFIGDLFIKDKKYLILIYSLAYSIVYIIYLIRSYKFSKGILNKK
jgi:O-antigen/teichoic acid export membrane protein